MKITADFIRKEFIEPASKLLDSLRNFENCKNINMQSLIMCIKNDIVLLPIKSEFLDVDGFYDKLIKSIEDDNIELEFIIKH